MQTREPRVGGADRGDLVLHQFAFSHFNEKARWGLDWKGVGHRRRTYLPGPHAGPMKRLSGQTTTPVLQLGSEVVCGSASILERLEQELPERPLYPSGVHERRRAEEIQTEFDRDVGPAVRTLLFSELLHLPGYMCRMFARDFSLPRRLGYRAAFPIARHLIARAYGTSDDGHVGRCRERTEQALELIERTAGSLGPLAGDRFSVADLCCAALLAPLFDPRHPDMARPQPVPPRLLAFLEPWAQHPAGDWVHEQYQRYRDGAAQSA